MLPQGSLRRPVTDPVEWTRSLGPTPTHGALPNQVDGPGIETAATIKTLPRWKAGSRGKVLQENHDVFGICVQVQWSGGWYGQ